MFPTFFKHKMKEVRSFFKIMKGKATSSDNERVKGAEEALKHLRDEASVYEQERLDALNGIDPDTKRYQGDDKEGRDISAI